MNPRQDHTPRLPGLDSLRGLAVAAVVAYHLQYLPGGFLGVDVFFVLSGYLITAIALREIDETERMGLRAFWGRRIRRLAPALFVMVPIILAMAALIGWEPTTFDRLGWDATATLSWWMNWREALGGAGGYWSPSPSPFRHAWSLSIEEQFYAVWPLVLLGAVVATRWVRRVRGRRSGGGSRRPAHGSRIGDRRAAPATVAAVVAGVLAMASALWSVVLAHHLDDADLSRVYLGTDTRIVAPLVGCASAAIIHRLTRTIRTRTIESPLHVQVGRVGAVAGVVAASSLAVMMATVDVDDPYLYRWGLLPLASVLAAVALLGARTVSFAEPVTGWLGRRSYAIYLWSWPIQILLTNRYPAMDQHSIAAVTVASTLVIAEASWWAIEAPAQRKRGWATERSGRRRAGLAMVGIAVASVMAVMATAAEPPIHARTTEDTVSDALRPQGSSAVTADADLEDESEPELERVMTIGDSMMYAATIYAPDPSELEGIESIDNRAANGCGLLAPLGYAYPTFAGGEPFPIGTDRFAVPTKCAPMDDAIDIGLAAGPTVVLVSPGAWEIGRVTAPDGELIEAHTPRMAEVLTDRLLGIARRVDAAGARLLVIPFACPGPEPAYEWATDPAAIDWINAVSAEVVSAGRAEGLAIAWTDIPVEVCAFGDATAEATAEKNQAMGGEIHIIDEDGGRWLWQTWWAPAITASADSAVPAGP